METKYYDTASPDVQRRFVKHLRAKLCPLTTWTPVPNRAYGLDYWSNRINAWEDFPDVRGNHQRLARRCLGPVPARTGDGIPGVAV